MAVAHRRPAPQNPGLLTSGHPPSVNSSRFSHAVLVLDLEGCSAEAAGAAAIEEALDERLRQHWADRAKAIIIEPEADVWMWGADSALREANGWPTGKGAIREWLRINDFEIAPHTDKPLGPKESLDAVLRDVSQPRSSSLYKKLAEKRAQLADSRNNARNPP